MSFSGLDTNQDVLMMQLDMKAKVGANRDILLMQIDIEAIFHVINHGFYKAAYIRLNI